MECKFCGYKCGWGWYNGDDFKQVQGVHGDFWSLGTAKRYAGSDREEVFMCPVPECQRTQMG